VAIQKKIRFVSILKFVESVSNMATNSIIKLTKKNDI